jgi:DnaJ-class molecular chaperone
MDAAAGDAYDILGVAPSSGHEAIKRAFRRLARRFHPDVNADPRAQERFMRIRAAYEELCDPDARARLDDRRRARRAAASGRGAEPLRPGASLFGGLGASILGRRPPPGVVTDLADLLAEALEGVATGGAPYLHERPRTFEERFTGRLTDSRKVELDAVLTRAEARAGLVIPFRFHLGPRLLREDLSIPPGVGKGDVLRYEVEAGAGVTLELLVHVDVV